MSNSKCKEILKNTLEKGNKLSSKSKQILSTFLGFMLMCFIFSIINPNFYSVKNILNVAVQTTPIVLIAMAQTYVLITAGIDLSVGATIGLAGVVTGMCMKSGVPVGLSILVGLFCGVIIGATNGILVVYGKITPFIATLGTMTAVRGLVLTLTGGLSINGLPNKFNQIGIGRTLGIPNPIYIMIFFVVVFGFILAKTKTGRYVYALGSNYEAARLSGVNTKRSLITVYMFSGLLSAVAGIILAARIITAPPTAGEGYELDSVAASVIGGASTMGGEGTIAGTVIGAFIIGGLRNGLNFSGVSPFIQKIVIGLVVIAAVFFDKIKHKN